MPAWSCVTTADAMAHGDGSAMCSSSSLKSAVVAHAYCLRCWLFLPIPCGTSQKV